MLCQGQCENEKEKVTRFTCTAVPGLDKHQPGKKKWSPAHAEQGISRALEEEWEREVRLENPV